MAPMMGRVGDPEQDVVDRSRGSVPGGSPREGVAEALRLAETIEQLLARAQGVYTTDYALRLALGLARNLKDELAGVVGRGGAG